MVAGFTFELENLLQALYAYSAPADHGRSYTNEQTNITARNDVCVLRLCTDANTHTKISGLL